MKQDTIWELRAEEVKKSLSQGTRLDHRKLDEYRNIKVETGLYKNAEGSARVKIGKTEVLCGVKILIGTPYPDSPDEGTISVGTEFMPSAAPEFRPGPPSEDSIELARVVDRGIREAKAIDFKELCITEGEEVLIVFVDLYISDYSGNLFDASSIAALAALKNAKIPKYEDGKPVKGEYVGNINLKRMPVLTTFGKIGNTIIVDPNLAEEKALDARFSMATTEDGFLTAFQKAGQGVFTKEEIDKMIDLAFKKGNELRKKVK